MSSKTARNAAPNSSSSLATRLTAWYAGSAFVMIASAVGFLYWDLVHSLDREDDNQIADQVRVLRDLLADRPDDLTRVRQEAEQEFQSRQHTQVYVRLLDANGRVLVETPGMARLLGPEFFPPPTTDFPSGSDRRAANGIPLRVMTVKVVEGPFEYTLQGAMDRRQEVELLAEYRRNLWVVLGSALVLSVIVGYQTAGRGLRPVHVVTDTARRIDTINLGERIELDGLPAELRILADTFNHMLERLGASFSRLSRFSADIAHELRTPVNNLRGEVEVSLGMPRTTNEYREVLASNLEEFDRLARLIESLLFLAKAENPQMQVVKERVDLVAELAIVCEFYEAAAGEKDVKLAVVVESPVQADLNRPLFQRAVGNLVENAVVHTPPGGVVTMTASTNDTSAIVHVTDTGGGVPAAHLPHVFDRFYRADQSRSSSGGNVGLGLAIVKSIVELHAGTIEMASGDGGTRVTMFFPRQMTKP